MRVLVVVAMEAEAQPIRRGLGLSGEGELMHPAFPAQLWTSGDVGVAVNGTDPRFGVASIATQPAVTTTLHAAERFEPDIVVSAGTCGGFAERGADIASTYLCDRVVFHDRRIAIDGFDTYGVGDYPVADLADLATALGFETGTATTGNALDAPEVDIAAMAASAAVAKDMEAAAVAWVCERLGVPFTALKVVTDLVDRAEATGDQFLRNLGSAQARLAEAVPALVEALTQR